MGQLWGFPTMLLLGILDSLTSALAHLVQAKTPPVLGNPPVISGSRVTDDTLVGNCITSLRLLGIEDWKTFLEGVSVVEQRLRLDPAQVYATMDFVTRNGYRMAVERFARLTNLPEETVAKEAIALCNEPQASSRKVHVVYCLNDYGPPE